MSRFRYYGSTDTNPGVMRRLVLALLLFAAITGTASAAPVVGIANDPVGAGYWLVANDGAVLAYGGATFYGSMAGKSLAAPVVGIAPTRTGKGYWLVGTDGGIF